MNNQWNQLLRYVRGDASAKLPKDEFRALIESVDARVAELEAQIAAHERAVVAARAYEFATRFVEMSERDRKLPTSSGEG